MGLFAPFIGPVLAEGGVTTKSDKLSKRNSAHLNSVEDAIDAIVSKSQQIHPLVVGFPLTDLGPLADRRLLASEKR